MTNKEQRIADALAPVVKQAGLFLEKVTISRAGKHSRLRVIVDQENGPGGVDTDTLEAVTRAVSDWCDETDPINGTYNLEVTTPGVERELTQWRHFSRAQGHQVKVTCGQQIFQGLLDAVSDDAITVVDENGAHHVPLDDITHAQMIVSL